MYSYKILEEEILFLGLRVLKNSYDLQKMYHGAFLLFLFIVCIYKTHTSKTPSSSELISVKNISKAMIIYSLEEARRHTKIRYVIQLCYQYIHYSTVS